LGRQVIPLRGIMNLFKDILKKINRQFYNIYIIKAVSLKQFLSHLPGFLFLYIFSKGRAPFPVNITLDLNYNCNLSCGYCYLRSTINNNSANSGQYLKSSDVRKLLGYVDKNDPTFFLTGGEPLLAKDLLDIIGLIKGRNFKCGLFTNGTLLNEAISDELVRLKLDYIFFSLDGPKDIHDSSRGRGTFEKVYSNIRYLSGKPPKIRPRLIINTVILDENIKHLLGLVDIANNLRVDCMSLEFIRFFRKEELSAYEDNFKRMFPQVSCGYQAYSYEPGNKYPKSLSEELGKIREYANRKKVKLLLKPDLSEKEISLWSEDGFNCQRRCFFPWNVIRISPRGEVYPCARFMVSMGNIHQDTIQGIWNNEKFRGFRRILKKEINMPGCSRCEKL